MKRLVLAISLIAFIFIIPGIVNAQSETQIFQDEVLEGVVTNIITEDETEVEGVRQYNQRLNIKVTKGSLSGKTIEVENGTFITSNSQKYYRGDNVMVSYTKDLEGKDLFIITDYIRRESLIWLFICFALLAVFVGRIWGITSLVGMVFSFFIIFKFILPQITSGGNPVLIAIIGSLFIIPVTFTLSHGFNIKTLISGISTVITLVIIGGVSNYFINASHLTGFSSEEASFLQFDLGGLLNMKGILLAGIIIASLGVLDDITISQTSIVKELRLANTKYTFWELYKSAMNVGRDHIASLINTLVLVYTGASLPILLLFISSSRSISEVINYEFIAEEIVRTLVASIGLILAVPIATLIASYYYSKK